MSQCSLYHCSFFSCPSCQCCKGQMSVHVHVRSLHLPDKQTALTVAALTVSMMHCFTSVFPPSWISERDMLFVTASAGAQCCLEVRLHCTAVLGWRQVHSSVLRCAAVSCQVFFVATCSEFFILFQHSNAHAQCKVCKEITIQVTSGASDIKVLHCPPSVVLWNHSCRTSLKT